MMVDEHLISLQPGTVIAGRYEVIKCLGSGNMGLVYACRHRELSGHIVAVKVLFPEVAQDKVAAARFRNEIFASYGVSHPNVVRAYEYLRDGELLAYTMEYVSGGDLADRLGNREQLIPIPEIIQYLSEMSSGLQAIHDAGIVHRDMKPENIMLTKDGHVKIADFGIARTGTGPRLTEHGGVVGTIEYVSPEYMLNSQVDWRSDIYALGIIGYEMITGEAAFQGESVYATMTKKLKTDPEPPSTKRSECPRRLDEIILRAMARNPDQRYQSAAEMFADLQELSSGDGRSVSAPMSRGPSVASTYVGPTLLKESAPAEQPVSDDFSTTNSGNRQKKNAARPAGYVPSVDLLSTPPGISPNESVNDQWAVAHKYSGSATAVGSGVSRSVNASRIEEEQPSGWSQPKNRRSAVKIRSTEENRFERLNSGVESNTRSLVMDLLTLVIAVVLGVAFGFVVLRTLFPDLLSSRHEGSVHIID